MWSLLVKPISDIVGKVIDHLSVDKTVQEQLRFEVTQALISADSSVIEQQVKVILAEAQGSWLQRNWRPILMLSIVAIVVNNYILFPYANLFGVQAVILELPPELFTLMTVGVGGYVAGRSAEKVMQEYKK